jgi:hypothetical protein
MQMFVQIRLFNLGIDNRLLEDCRCFIASLLKGKIKISTTLVKHNDLFSFYSYLLNLSSTVQSFANQTKTPTISQNSLSIRKQFHHQPTKSFFSLLIHNKLTHYQQSYFQENSVFYVSGRFLRPVSLHCKMNECGYLFAALFSDLDICTNCCPIYVV